MGHTQEPASQRKSTQWTRWYKSPDGKLMRRELPQAPADPKPGGPVGKPVGKLHRDRIDPRKRPKDKSVWLMKLCIRAARAGGWKDARIADVVSEESGIKLTPAMISAWKRKWPRFREQMAAAQDEVLDNIEASFVRRALEGDDTHAYKYGMAMLRSRRAEFREKVEVNTHFTGNVHHFIE